jgi:hypothetical protein
MYLASVNFAFYSVDDIYFRHGYDGAPVWIRYALNATKLLMYAFILFVLSRVTSRYFASINKYYAVEMPWVFAITLSVVSILASIPVLLFLLLAADTFGGSPEDLFYVVGEQYLWF